MVDDRKRLILDAIEALDGKEPLTNGEKELFDNVIKALGDHLDIFARKLLNDLSLPESEWSPFARVSPEQVAGISREALRRELDKLLIEERH